MEEDDETTMFCGNVASKVTEALLYELFLQAGPIESLRMPKKDNAHRGFAFVKFKHECAVQYAVELFDGTELDGRQLTLRNNSKKFRQRSHSTGGYDSEPWRRHDVQPLLMLPPHHHHHQQQQQQQQPWSYNQAPPPQRHHDSWRNSPYQRRHESDRRHSDGRHHDSDRHSNHHRHRDRRH